MTAPLQTYFEAWRDAIFHAMTPRQRALLKSGHRVRVRVGATQFLICPDTAMAEEIIDLDQSA
jgi:hypothetical protein